MQGRGIGKALLRHSLDAAAAQGHAVCVVVGDPNYYRPFGFISASAQGLSLPGPVEPERFQVKALQPGALAGVHGVIARARPEGAASTDGRVRGCYLHGLFASDAFRASYLAEIGAAPSDTGYEDGVDAVLDALAAHIEAWLDVDALIAMAAAAPRRRTGRRPASASATIRSIAIKRPASASSGPAKRMERASASPSRRTPDGHSVISAGA